MVNWPNGRMANRNAGAHAALVDNNLAAI